MVDYLEPTAEEAQGDIYDGAPLLDLRVWPLTAIRPRTFSGNRHALIDYPATGEPPPGGFKWEYPGGEGEIVLARGLVGRAIVLTHECDIENLERFRVIAMIRPISVLDATLHLKLFSYEMGAAFPLTAQDAAPPRMPLAFVDFRRLTVISPEVLKECKKVACVCDQVRKALATHFSDFLFRRIVDAADPSVEAPV